MPVGPFFCLHLLPFPVQTDMTLGPGSRFTQVERRAGGPDTARGPDAAPDTRRAGHTRYAPALGYTSAYSPTGIREQTLVRKHATEHSHASTRGKGPNEYLPPSLPRRLLCSPVTHRPPSVAAPPGPGSTRSRATPRTSRRLTSSSRHLVLALLPRVRHRARSRWSINPRLEGLEPGPVDVTRLHCIRAGSASGEGAMLSYQ